MTLNKILPLILFSLYSFPSFSQISAYTKPRSYNYLKPSRNTLDLEYQIIREKERQHSSTPKINCEAAYYMVKKIGESLGVVDVDNSSWLTKIEGYWVPDAEAIFVVISKKNSFGEISSYIYCDIPLKNWQNFAKYDTDPSWGRKFHKYVEDYPCNCY
jgi:hypothetical protein